MQVDTKTVNSNTLLTRAGKLFQQNFMLEKTEAASYQIYCAAAEEWALKGEIDSSRISALDSFVARYSDRSKPSAGKSFILRKAVDNSAPARVQEAAPLKFCPRCKKEISKAKFSPHAGKADGLQPWCRECCNDYSKERGRKRVEAASTERKCSVCDKTQDINEYAVDKKGHSGRSSRCRTCKSEWDNLVRTVARHGIGCLSDLRAHDRAFRFFSSLSKKRQRKIQRRFASESGPEIVSPKRGRKKFWNNVTLIDAINRTGATCVRDLFNQGETGAYLYLTTAGRASKEEKTAASEAMEKNRQTPVGGAAADEFSHKWTWSAILLSLVVLMFVARKAFNF